MEAAELRRSCGGGATVGLLIDLTSPCDVLVLFNYESSILITTHHSAAMINISASHKSTCHNKVPGIGINHDAMYVSPVF